MSRLLMRIAFLNPNLAHEYDVGTPFIQPLAGSQSAQCYLAIEMARRGHRVELFTGIKQRKSALGVDCYPVGEFGISGIPDVVFVLNHPPCARQLRSKLPPELPIFCWEHNPWSPDPGYHEHLLSTVSPMDRVLCVSDWQKRLYIEQGVPADTIAVVRNAVSPCFESTFVSDDRILDSKAWPPVMAFTSTPYKGLKAATLFFQELRRLRGSVTLNLFSSFDLYPPTNEHRLDRSWDEFYDSCRRMPGVNYVGNVSQKALARTLKSTLILFFPSVLPETSSICVLEAMASGCIVICSALGGLPEVAGGFGRVIPLQDGRTLQGKEFIAAAVEVLSQFDRNDDSLERELQQQVSYIRDHCVWGRRAIELESILAEVVRA